MNKITKRNMQSSSLSLLLKGLISMPLVAGLLTITAPTFAQENNMSNSKPHVLLLATGGTIAGAADDRGAGAYNAGALKAQQLISAVPGIEKLAQISAEQVASIGSQDMTNDVWLKLANRIQKAFDQGEADAVVITHGTDSMEETAFFLDHVVKTDNPIVLVGSMRPSTALSADGPANLYQAVQVATDKQSIGRGAMVVMNERIDGARGVTKAHTTAVQTMQSPNLGAMGYLDFGHVRFIKSPISNRVVYTLPKGTELPRVEIIYSHANMDAKQIEHAIDDKARGIVLAGFGDGNASKEALTALEKAAAKGIVVVRSTRVSSGYVNRNVEIDDDKSGFVASMDLNPQKARILTQLLILNGITQSDQVQKAFLQAQ